jgi:hypothetical protein
MRERALVLARLMSWLRHMCIIRQKIAVCITPSSERGSAENDGLFVIYYANSGCYEKPIRSALLVRRQNQIGIEFANKS